MALFGKFGIHDKTTHTDSMVQTPFILSGLGTASDPFLIRTLYDLIYMKDRINNGQPINDTKNANTAHYALMDNFDLGGVPNWIPIGTKISHPFRGSFTGQGHCLSNLKVSETSTGNLGLFGFIEDAFISHLTIEIDHISAANDACAGGLVGWAHNSKIFGVSVVPARQDSCIHTESMTGGLIGYGVNCELIACANQCPVFGFMVGGLIGYAQATIKINVCNNYGSVEICSVKGSAGGLIGQAEFFDGYPDQPLQLELENCISLGIVQGCVDPINTLKTSDMGKLVGCLIENSKSTVKIANNWQT